LFKCSNKLVVVDFWKVLFLEADVSKR
jgi:hypothetical protein